MDAQTRTLLQGIVLRESRSVLAYTSEAFPWTSAAHSDAAKSLLSWIQEEADALTALGRYLVRRRVPIPHMGSFPASFTTINFLALDYLLPQLQEYEQSSLAQLENELKGITDPDARALVEKLCEIKKSNLARMATLRSNEPESTAV